MVRLLFIIGLVFWLLPMDSSGQSKVGDRIVIVIDPGHGGTDFGAIVINAVREKDMVLKIAKEVVDLSENLFGESYEIYLTRYSDTLISLEDRAKMVESLNTDMLISLHCNHSGNPNVKGVEIYVLRYGEHLHASTILAYQLQKGLRQNIGFKSRGVKFTNFKVLRETVDYCPAVLVELGFLSNLDEAQHLTADENLLALALSLLSGLKIKK